jgi:hypothetical protein
MSAKKTFAIAFFAAFATLVTAAGGNTTTGSSPACTTDQECIERCTAIQMSDQCNLFACGTDKSCKGAESHDENSTITIDQSDGPSPCGTDQNCKDKCNSTHLMKASDMCDAMVCDVTAKLCSVDGSKVLPFCESDKLFGKCEATCGNSPESEGCMLPLSRSFGDGDCDPFADAPKWTEDVASVKTDMCAIKTTCETCVVDATNSACNDMHESPVKKHETHMAAYAQCIDGEDAARITARKNDALERAEMQAKLHGVPQTLFDDGGGKMLERVFAGLESIADTMKNPCGKLSAGDAEDLCNDCSRISKQCIVLVISYIIIN